MCQQVGEGKEVGEVWVSKKKWQATERRLAHIESLLQRMPEMVAAAYLIEKEKNEMLPLGKKYSDTVILCPVEER